MADERAPVVLGHGEGRTYDMGRIQAVFKADGGETGGSYSVSEWWLEANTSGPGAHHHEKDDLFYVLEGTMSIFVDDRWIEAEKGSFVLVPGGTTHDFQNRSTARAGMLSFSHPGDFEEELPAIVEWFAENPAGDAVP
jgi:mannose-6-phosphate isomerase-like protein (cupin superfamily)